MKSTIFSILKITLLLFNAVGVIEKLYMWVSPHDFLNKKIVRVGKCPHERRLEKMYKFVAENVPQARHASLLA
jgi:hypothetical protein